MQVNPHIYGKLVDYLDIKGKFRNFIVNSKHVLNISYRPTHEEFNRSAKVIVIGILIIGFLGFIIGLIISLFTS
ncbi:MAG: protein translocase SEC61 complex subunit gamma [Candidatus Micrarchaeia archaeon]